MAHLSTSAESAIGQAILNGDMSSGTNPMFYALGVTQAANSSNLYLSLHTANPGGVGGSEAGASECTNTNWGAGTYSRVAIRREKSWGSGTSKWTEATSSGPYFTNLEAINFPICGTGATGTAKFWGLWDSLTGGRLIQYGPLKASGAVWNLGYHTGFEADGTTVNAKFVYSGANTVANTDPIIMYGLYNGVIPAIANANVGIEDTVTSRATNTFQLTTTSLNATYKAFMYIETAFITLADGKIPAVPAGGLVLRFT